MIAAVLDAVRNRLGGPHDLEGRAQIARFWDRRAFITNMKEQKRKAAVGRIEHIAVVGHRTTCPVCKSLSMCDVLASMIADIQLEARNV